MLNYDNIALHYDRHRRGGGPYLDGIVEQLDIVQRQRVLEFGAGTGNNTRALQEVRPNIRLTALEPSAGMLAKGVLKASKAHWIRAHAQQLPFAEDSFDFIFSVYVLHHIENLCALFKECARVLQNGTVACVTASHDFIRQHPMNQYFPSFAEVDLARFQSVEVIQEAMHASGFRKIGATPQTAPPQPIDAAYVQKIEEKFISTYDLLPEDEFRDGVTRLRAEVQAHGQLEEPFRWQAVTVWASL